MQDNTSFNFPTLMTQMDMLNLPNNPLMGNMLINDFASSQNATSDTAFMETSNMLATVIKQ